MPNNRTKTIVRNTLYMYGRMFVMLIISLFTSRIIFQTLGVDDYGTYSVVGGIIVFFTFLNNGLSSATRRFITASLGKGNNEETKHTFSVSINSHIIISALILFLAETIGVWCVIHLLNIPQGRENAAMWAYQLSVISAVLSIIQSPYESAIVASEKMDIYAYMSISDAIFKLLIIYLLQAFTGDKLIIYAWLIFAVGILNIIIRVSYCINKVSFARYSFTKDNKLLKSILSFTSWSLLGQASVVSTNQGVSVLVNIFHNVAVNAAQGVASTINGIIFGFVGGFQTAFNPQIIKSYNNGEHHYLNLLILRSSKITSYLLAIFIIPLLFETENVLTIWLGSYPQFAVEFCILTIVCSYFDGIASPLWMTISSQTNIKTYQIVISIVYSFNFILAWICLSLGDMPYHVLTARIVVTLFLIITRLYFTKKYLPSFCIWDWINEVVIRSLVVIIASIITIAIIKSIIPHLITLLEIITITVVSLIITIPLIYTIGTNKEEREAIKDFINKRTHRYECKR